MTLSLHQLFESKVDCATYFSTETECIHGQVF